MKRESLRLYFMAIVPDEPVYSEVLDFKSEFRDRFKSSAALRSPPHITLHMPFQWQEEKEDRLCCSLDKVTCLHQPFQLVLNNFGCFSPRVIFINVEESEPLIGLQKAVQNNAKRNLYLYPKPSSRPFSAHMTIAFRDLKKPRFFEAWKEFALRKYSSIFTINDLCLLKHNGKSWDILHRALLA